MIVPLPAHLIEVPAGKGCILFLTPAEYMAGVRRGKRILRRRRFEERLDGLRPARPQSPQQKLMDLL